MDNLTTDVDNQLNQLRLEVVEDVPHNNTINMSFTELQGLVYLNLGFQ